MRRSASVLAAFSTPAFWLVTAIFCSVPAWAQEPAANHSDLLQLPPGDEFRLGAVQANMEIRIATVGGGRRTGLAASSRWERHINARCAPGDCGMRNLSVLYAPIGIGVGTALGALINADSTDQRTLWRRDYSARQIAPLLGQGRVGLTVRVLFGS
jgi:hypothetical protein